MCGILAMAGNGGEFHHRMLHSLRKRGPDEIGFWTNGEATLAQTRLAVIGLDERATEPHFNDRYVLAFNGEIYNFHEIKRELGDDARAAANDAEVLLHAWTRWGIDVLPKLHGFWAFVVYDKSANTLTLVRDQLGIKPLYYSVSDFGVCVSSMIRTILEVVRDPVELDYDAMSEYARYQLNFGDKTFIKQIRKVLPGHLVSIDLNTFEVEMRCYEDIYSSEASTGATLGPAWYEETRELLRECVLESTISDTSFTTFCSGGIDSSLITAIAQPEVAYHCNFSDPDCNETFFAQRVVEDLPTRLLVVNAQEEFNLVGRLREIVEDFDEPTIGSVILPLDDLLSQVKRRYKVILNGTGGDELFAGYVRYMLALGQCNQDNYRALFQRTQRCQTAAERFELCHRKGDPGVFAFYDDSVEKTFVSAFEGCRDGTSDFQTMLRFDQRYFLPGLLAIEDKIGGRHSLEARPSLLHQRFVRHLQGTTMSPEVFMKDGELKPVLRKLAREFLPTSVLQRKDKMGFTTPVGTFVNNSAHQIREQIMNSPYRDHYNIKKINFTAQTKYSREVFGLLLVDLWLNTYAANVSSTAFNEDTVYNTMVRA